MHNQITLQLEHIVFFSLLHSTALRFQLAKAVGGKWDWAREINYRSLFLHIINSNHVHLVCTIWSSWDQSRPAREQTSASVKESSAKMAFLHLDRAVCVSAQIQAPLPQQNLNGSVLLFASPACIASPCVLRVEWNSSWNSCYQCVISLLFAYANNYRALFFVAVKVISVRMTLLPRTGSPLVSIQWHKIMRQHTNARISLLFHSCVFFSTSVA